MLSWSLVWPDGCQIRFFGDAACGLVKRTCGEKEWTDGAVLFESRVLWRASLSSTVLIEDPRESSLQKIRYSALNSLKSGMSKQAHFLGQFMH